MSYCTLDEAFGPPFNHCIKKKQKKINCNENKTRFKTRFKTSFDENLKDTNSKIESFQNYNPAEAFEYNENDNKPIKEIVDVDNDVDYVDISDVDNSSGDNSDVEIVKVKKSKKNKPPTQLINKFFFIINIIIFCLFLYSLKYLANFLFFLSLFNLLRLSGSNCFL
jgi:hypothetical protein